jgi:hypothetical protein
LDAQGDGTVKSLPYETAQMEEAVTEAADPAGRLHGRP